MYLYIPSNSAPASECSEKGYAPPSDFLASTTAPFFTWNGKLQQPPSLSRLWKREPLIRRLSGLTCSPLMAERGVALWISSLRDSRAKTSASPVGVQALTARGLGSSSTSSTSRTIAMRQDSFWRTSQASLLPPPPLWTKPKASSKNVQPPVSWENWPTVGGMRSGSLFPHPTWAPAMGAPGGSASPGEWLTPNVPNGGRCLPADVVAAKGMTEAGKKSVGLESQSRHWMTPSVSNSQGNEYTRDRGQPGQERLTLTGQAQQWPTPRGTDGTKGGPNQAGRKGDLMLPSAAAQWPTPTLQDSESAGGAGCIDRGKRGHSLNSATLQWPTPASRDYRTPNSQESQESQESRKHTGGEQLPNFVEHHFLHPVHSTLDGRPLSPTGRTLPLQFPVTLTALTSDASTHALASGSWAGQSVGRRA